jgi:hypothetical protein
MASKHQNQGGDVSLSRGFRKGVILCLAVVTGAIIGKAQTPAPSTSGEAAAILNAAREALGGEKRLSSIKTITATGRTRQVQGDNLVPIEFEIFIELPDKYVRTDEIPARESGPTSRGFNGDGLIQFPEPVAPPPRAGGPPAGAPSGGGAPGGPAVRAGGPGGPGPGGPGGPPPNPTIPLKQDFARLTLGMFASSFSTYPLAFAYAGQAEAPEGKADVLDVKGAPNFTARLFVDSKTRLPLMLSWQTPANLVPVAPGQAPPPNLPPGTVTFEAPGPQPGPTATAEERTKFQQDLQAARAKAMAAAKPIENRIYYADYRDVDGLKFPFRIRRAVGATTTEETTFDRFRTNPKIDPRKFEVKK